MEAATNFETALLGPGAAEEVVSGWSSPVAAAVVAVPGTLHRSVDVPSVDTSTKFGTKQLCGVG